MAGDRWVYYACNALNPEIMHDENMSVESFVPRVTETYYHRQCVPLNLAVTGYNYTPT